MRHHALDLPRRLAALGRRRAIGAVVLNAVAGVTEGIGVLALVPLLKLLGIGNRGEAPPDPWIFALVLTGYVLLAGVAAHIGQTRHRAAQALTLDFLDRLRADLHAAILAMEWNAFRKRRSADLQQAMTGEIGRIHMAVTALGNLTGALLAIPFLAAAALFLSPALTGAALVMVVLAAAATRHLNARSWLLGRQLGEANKAAMADLADNLAGLRLIKIFTAEAAREEKLSSRFADARRNQRAYERAHATERAVLQTIAAAAAAGGLSMAVFLLRLPLAEALTLMLAYGRLLQAALRCLSNWRRLAGASAALATYDETLAACRAAAEPPAIGTPSPSLQREMRFSGVVVRHDEKQGHERGAPVLDHIDAVIPAGKITALIGPSGAGKSTLLDLALGLTTPDGGHISIDGVRLSPDVRRAWRRSVSACPQDPFLFHDTLRANLRLACPDADDGALWAALEAVAAADFVRALPQGLDTVAGDRGLRFSGGERQRLALARAWLHRPAFLALDEATASLDGETETAVARALANLRGSCTVLVVAHRPSTVQAADHVLMLDAGRLTAAGTWDDVRAAAGPRLAALGMAGPRQPSP
ncbi:ATP-binding cassette subfamily C protein [Azospirillum fermentarium]|uniref:ABC transporter ATP-binding protein n=1 Tax=Azospirillum fermentarium TaxID=1233114 RepID=UPI0022275BBB|nr:ABC transporter ATP-binding protein [Azospirillum fermentarium]MCW2249580.1 ATP-binding cassette subfamily C protein [Azospirillum fermentarium]